MSIITSKQARSTVSKQARSRASKQAQSIPIDKPQEFRKALEYLLIELEPTNFQIIVTRRVEHFYLVEVKFNRGRSSDTWSKIYTALEKVVAGCELTQTGWIFSVMTC